MIVTETAERLAAMEQLRHADRLRTVGRLAAGLAHELGTPLNVVSGRAGLIASGKLEPDEILHSAATIKTEADRITEIVRQLLDFARRRQPKRVALDLRIIARRTVELLQPLAAKRDIVVRLIDDEDPVSACIDQDQIQQVLTNLVMNAIQAVDSGGEVRLRLGSELRPDNGFADTEPSDYARIAVEDQGMGISEEQLEHIFEPFYTTKDVGEGTGLGLSIAHGIVQEHQGWIDVSSSPGMGTCFTVYLPKESEICTDES
jgi:signal transduction histidine kinase